MNTQGRVAIALLVISFFAFTADAAADCGEWAPTPVESSLGIVPADFSYAPGDVRRYGADPTGTVDSHSAFATAWSTIKSTGGELIIPPGTYTLSAPWVLDVDQTLPFNYSIRGYGAELKAYAVTGYAIKVYKGYNNFGVRIEGLHFNHRNNSTVGGCIQGQGASHLRIVNCSVEMHNTKETYAAIELGPHTVGDKDTNCFWALIDGFKTRQRSGGDGTKAAVGVRLKGSANATKIVNCSFGDVVDAIRLETDGTAAALANSCIISFNDFEGVTNAVTINTASPAKYMPTGIRITHNRCESLKTFVNITGAAVYDPAYPLVIKDNSLIVGSVSNYLVNPNNQFIFSDESSYFGVGQRVFVGGPGTYQIVADGAGNHLKIGNLSGSSSWNQGHLVMGAYHFWVESATGKLRMKNSAPTSDSDGTVVGAQN